MIDITKIISLLDQSEHWAVYLIQCMGPPLLVKPFMVGTHLVSGKLPCASPTRLHVLPSWTGG